MDELIGKEDSEACSRHILLKGTVRPERLCNTEEKENPSKVQWENGYGFFLITASETTLIVRNVDSENGFRIAGSSLVIVHEGGEQAAAFVTNSSEDSVITGLAPGTYIIRETGTPQGYYSMPEGRLTIRDTEEEQTISAFRKRITYSINTNVPIAGNPLVKNPAPVPGSVLSGSSIKPVSTTVTATEASITTSVEEASGPAVETGAEEQQVQEEKKKEEKVKSSERLFTGLKRKTDSEKKVSGEAIQESPEMATGSATESETDEVAKKPSVPLPLIILLLALLVAAGGAAYAYRDKIAELFRKEE